MKHWKRNPSQAGVARTPGSRNVLLRFYPPQTAIRKLNIFVYFIIHFIFFKKTTQERKKFMSNRKMMKIR